MGFPPARTVYGFAGGWDDAWETVLKSFIGRLEDNVLKALMIGGSLPSATLDTFGRPVKLPSSLCVASLRCWASDSFFLSKRLRVFTAFVLNERTCFWAVRTDLITSCADRTLLIKCSDNAVSVSRLSAPVKKNSGDAKSFTFVR
jgi:hypothetical protein